MRFKKVCLLGLGYIGLPTAALMASKGLSVRGVDIDRNVVEKVSQGKVHIVEPDLDGLVQKVVSDGALTAHLTPDKADVFLIAVPTPIHDDRSADVSLVDAAIESIAPHLCPGNLIILESTLPVGTTDRAALQLSKMRPDLVFPIGGEETPNINMAYCPERVLPGKILQELVHNDRSIGGLTPACTLKAATFYQTFCLGDCFQTTARTAELVKLSENAFRDVNIAFANELSVICDELEIDAWEMIALANKHPRVDILKPGPGVGGHCISVDPWFIVSSSPDNARIIRTAREVNEAKPDYIVEKVYQTAKRLENPIIACLGLAFKADVDDLRNSPAMTVTEQLAKRCDGQVIAVEPNLTERPANLEKLGVQLLDTLTAIEQADIVVVLVDHRQFKLIDPHQLGDKVIVDTKGLWPDVETKRNPPEQPIISRIVPPRSQEALTAALA